MRLNEIVTENRHLYWQRRMDENVVKPYVNYLQGLNTYLTEAAATDPISQMVQQSGGNPDAMVLPPQVQQNFAANLPPADSGPVQGFEQKAKEEANKIQDTEVKKTLMDKIKTALKNPDTQQTILSAVSSIAGMAAGAATLGLGKDAAKSAVNAIGQGLIATLNAKMTGADWTTAAKQGLAHGAAHAAGDELGVNAKDLKKAAGLTQPGQAPGAGQSASAGQSDSGPITAPPGTTPQGLKQEWQKFVNFGQGLLNKMVPADENPVNAAT